MEEFLVVRYQAPLSFVGVLCLLWLVVVFFDGLAPAGRGGEGSERLEIGRRWWMAWVLPSWREDGWIGEGGAMAELVHCSGSSSRSGERFCGRLHEVEVLSSLRMAVRRLRRQLGSGERGGGSDCNPLS